MNGHKRRDSAEIVYEILNAASSGKRKTSIMYESKLNLKQLNYYLGDLTARGLLVFEPSNRNYLSTEKGRTFAKAFQHYRETTDLLREQEAALGRYFTPKQKSVEVRQ